MILLILVIILLILAHVFRSPPAPAENFTFRAPDFKAELSLARVPRVIFAAADRLDKVWGAEPDTIIVFHAAPEWVDQLVRWAVLFPDACIAFGGLDCAGDPIFASPGNYVVSPMVFTLEGPAAYRRRFLAEQHSARAAAALGASLMVVPGPQNAIPPLSPSPAHIKHLIKREFQTEFVWTKSYFLLAQHFDPKCFFFQEISRNIDGAAVRSGDVICIRPECVPHFCSSILPSILAPFILITCDSTNPPAEKWARALSNDRRLLAWFSTAPAARGARRIPAGVDYFTNYFQVPSVSLEDQESALKAGRAIRRRPGVYEGKIHFRVWPHVGGFMAAKVNTEIEACEACVLGVRTVGEFTVRQPELELAHWRAQLEELQLRAARFAPDKADSWGY